MTSVYSVAMEQSPDCDERDLREEWRGMAAAIEEDTGLTTGVRLFLDDHPDLTIQRYLENIWQALLDRRISISRPTVIGREVLQNQAGVLKELEYWLGIRGE